MEEVIVHSDRDSQYCSIPNGNEDAIFELPSSFPLDIATVNKLLRNIEYRYTIQL